MPSKPIRVLLLEDDPADVRLLEMMLHQVAPDQFKLVPAARLSEAVKLAGKEPFDIVLSDLTVPDSEGLATFVQLQAQARGLPIVVFSGIADESMAIQAVEKGAQDYLIKGQANGALIARALRYAVERHWRQSTAALEPAPARGRLSAFIGAKGGVGTTTVAANVAVALAQQQRRVILAELRPSFGTLALHLRRSPPVANLHTILEVGIGSINGATLNAHLSGAVGGLRVLFGPQRPAEFKDIDPGQAAYVVEGLLGLADHVVLDLPSQPSAASEAALRKCDDVVLVVERDAACIAAGAKLMEVLRAWEIASDRIGAVVVNRVPASLAMKPADFRAALGCDVISVVPPAYDACADSQQAALPLIVFQPQHAAAAALAELTMRLAANAMAAVRTA